MSGRRERKIQCPCQTCLRMGGRLVKASTATEHLRRQNAIEHVLQQFNGRELDGELDGPDDNEVQGDLTQDEDIVLNDKTREEDLEVGWEAQDVECEPQCSTETPIDREDITLEQAILNQIIYVQSQCDKHGANIGLQDFLMHQFVGGFTSQRRAPMVLDFNQQPLGLLMSQLPAGWDGTLDGYAPPDSWRKLMHLYARLGMVLPQRWRICVGTYEHEHEGVVFKPSDEDCDKFGHILQCQLHGGNLRDCLECCEKCSVCKQARKDMKAFDYLPIGPQLALIMQSSLFCHEIREMWRNNQEWLGKAAGDFVDPIKNFWDGSKVRLCQNFWNPGATWELLVVCPQCKTSHKAFPRKCEELLDPRNWDESSQVYKFLCRQCRHLVVSPKQMLQEVELRLQAGASINVRPV